MADDEKFDGSDDASQERPEDGANENESDFSTDDSGEIGANNRVSEHLKPHYNKDGQLILPDGTNLIQTSIQDELKASYLTYSMSVIVSRAIPDVRDGLKPSQRRILVAMNDLNLGPHSQRVKCAKISGDASGNYHPHGEAIIYPTLVRMAQDWNMRHVLVDKQGNFGSIAGLPPAAMRYTEARLSGFAVAMLEDLNLDTVDFMPTYDETRMEPVVLPSKAPNLLVNGANGIAVGMATSIPPHNLGEICDAAVAVIDNPDVTIQELMRICPGPDFPTGGVICGARGKDAALSAYIDLYLREEIQQEGLVRTLAPFARFLESASFSHGSQLVSSAIARDCGVGRTTVDGYLKILEDLMIGVRLPVFSKRAKRELVAHEKFYFFDCGVFRALRPKGPLDRPSEIDGAALEGLVFQHLRAWNDCSGAPDTLGYWRTRAGVEVDFVLYGERDFAAIEVKNAAVLRPDDFAGLKSFREDYPEARPVLLYRGEERFLSDGILVLPVEDFLRALLPGRPPLAAF